MYTQYYPKSYLNAAEFFPKSTKFSLIIVPLKQIVPETLLNCIYDMSDFEATMIEITDCLER